VVVGRVVGLPSGASAAGTVSLPVEVPEGVAPAVVAVDDVRIVLLQPADDAASTAAAAGS
jgi:cell division septation protein DedD